MAARREDAITEVAKRIGEETGAEVLPIAVDLSTPQGPQRFVDTTVRHFGAIDVLVTNTGGPPAGPFEEHNDEAWQQAFDSLLMSVTRLCRAVYPALRDRGGGAVIHNASFTVKEPEPGLVLSNALRAAVVALSKTLAREWAAYGIRMNVVCPGPFDTERLRELIDGAATLTGRTSAELRKDWTSRIPLGRLLAPTELANLVVFLASDLGSGITGTVVPVDGGLLRGVL
jgi:3-oxoacyl-[acyl-carrier protein] reductase